LRIHRRSQRGIRPGDIEDAVSRGRIFRSSKQNLFFQTKVRAHPLLHFSFVKGLLPVTGCCRVGCASSRTANARCAVLPVLQPGFQSSRAISILFQVAVTAFQAQPLVGREAEGKQVDGVDRSIFSQRKRGWSVRRNSADA
jgi:hypothetical protein